MTEELRWKHRQILINAVSRLRDLVGIIELDLEDPKVEYRSCEAGEDSTETIEFFDGSVEGLVEEYIELKKTEAPKIRLVK